MDSLHDTVRVLTDGTVVHGIEVPDMGAKRVDASPPRYAKGSQFRGHGGVPSDTYVPDKRSRSGWRRTNILGVTHPHDCRNHIIEEN